MSFRTTAALAIGFLCATFFPGWVMAQEAAGVGSCQLRQYAAITVTRSGGRFLLPVVIRNQPFMMVLNIRSSRSFIYPEAARLVNPEQFPIAIRTHHADKLVALARIPEIQLGGLRFQNLTAVVWDFDADNDMPMGAPVPVIGALGSDFFSRFDLELDLARNRLNLYEHTHCASPVYWSNSYSMSKLTTGNSGVQYFPMELEGRPVDVALNPWKICTAVPQELGVLFGWNDQSGRLEHSVSVRGRPVTFYRSTSLSNDGMVIRNQWIRLAPTSKKFTRVQGNRLVAASPGDPIHFQGRYGRTPALELGLDVMVRLHLFIQTSDQQLFYTLAFSSSEGETAVPLPRTLTAANDVISIEGSGTLVNASEIEDTDAVLN